MTRDEAADVFTMALAKVDLPLTVKTDLLHAATEWVYAAQTEAVDESFEAARRAHETAMANVFGPPANPTTLGEVWVGTTKPDPGTLANVIELRKERP